MPTSHVIAPSTQHTHTVIFLHGRGSECAEFSGELFESQDSKDRFFPEIFPSVKWVFPRGLLPYMDEENCYQWFDMTVVQHPNEDIDVQKPGLRDSVESILEIIKNESREVCESNIILGGISQGCATSILSLLFSGIRLGGFVGLCGWLPLQEQIRTAIDVCAKPQNQLFSLRNLIGPVPKNALPGHGGEHGLDLGTPILLQHSRDDSVVPVRNGEILMQEMKKMGATVEWQCFDHGGHWLNEPAGMDGIVTFLEFCMGKGIIREGQDK